MSDRVAIMTAAGSAARHAACDLRPPLTSFVASFLGYGMSSRESRRARRMGRQVLAVGTLEIRARQVRRIASADASPPGNALQLSIAPGAAENCFRGRLLRILPRRDDPVSGRSRRSR